MSVHHQDEFDRLSRPQGVATPRTAAELAVAGWLRKSALAGPDDSLAQTMRRGASKAIARAERSGFECSDLRNALETTFERSAG